MKTGVEKEGGMVEKKELGVGKEGGGRREIKGVRRERWGGRRERERGCRERHTLEHTHLQVQAGKAQRRPASQEPTRRSTRNDRG